MRVQNSHSAQNFDAHPEQIHSPELTLGKFSLAFFVHFE
jgi:hypothetical protein